jgi:hypothetical protein
MLKPFYSEVLSRTEVTISGEWRSGSPRDWWGRAHASEPLVAVSLLIGSEGISWCKSERGKPDGQSIRLLLGHHDAEGCDVQVNFSVGGGQVVSRTFVQSREYIPKLLANCTVSTASIFNFASVEGSNSITLAVIFLAAADVRMGRNGLWHLRRDFAESVPDAYRQLLSFGRTGYLAAA